MNSPKKLQSEIKQIADSLPEQFDVNSAKVTMTGIDIHLSGLPTTGVENDDTEYLLTIPIYIKVAHKRALNKAYKRNGIKGIIDYVDTVYK